MTADGVRRLDSPGVTTPMHCLLTPRDDGSRSIRPAPGFVETAMVGFVLALSGDRAAKGAVARARRWLFNHPADPTVSSLTHMVENALWSLAVDDGEPVDLGAVPAQTPEEAQLVNLVHVLAVYGDRPVHGGLNLQELRHAFQEAYGGRGDEPRPDSGSPESLAVAVLLDVRLREDQPSWMLVEHLMSVQERDGSYAWNVVVTALALLALVTSARDSDAFRRCQEYLLATQRADGTWLNGPADVLEPEPTVRSFREDSVSFFDVATDRVTVREAQRARPPCC
ncbi:hypothetical protein [Streptomyces wedmorensis]|uniref:hypothetical protein n=1 Tax=Streptomyces wedmorensis TaxID=43759 RepID=UPI0037AF8C39